MTKYTILGPIYPPEKCYLFEVLLWRAFGRFPEMHYSDNGKDWRFESDVRDGYEAPIPDGSELSEGECSYAGIPLDPSMQALLEDKTTLDVSFYDKWITKFSETEENSEHLAKTRQEREEAIAYGKATAEWAPIFDDYVDPFCAEIFLALHNGTLRAFGTKLLDVNYEKVLFDDTNYWDSTPATDIPSQTWISDGIKWSDSALKGREEHFIWVHVITADMLSVFPPTQLIKPGSAQPVGENFAISTSELSKSISSPSKRGRPALPWEQFHVEVARLFRDAEMPIKQEAAIAQLQDWFQKSIGKKVSRSAIGEKLKPYFDKLVREDRK